MTAGILLLEDELKHWQLRFKVHDH